MSDTISRSCCRPSGARLKASNPILWVSSPPCRSGRGG